METKECWGKSKSNAPTLTETDLKLEILTIDVLKVLDKHSATPYSLFFEALGNTILAGAATAQPWFIQKWASKQNKQTWQLEHIQKAVYFCCKVGHLTQRLVEICSFLEAAPSGHVVNYNVRYFHPSYSALKTRC